MNIDAFSRESIRTGPGESEECFCTVPDGKTSVNAMIRSTRRQREVDRKCSKGLGPRIEEPPAGRQEAQRAIPETAGCSATQIPCGDRTLCPS